MAKAAGRVDIDQFLTEISPDDFQRWVEFNEVSPIGDEKLAWVFASGLALICNLIIGTAAFGINDIKEVVSARDLIPWLKKKERDVGHVNPNQMAAHFQAAIGGMNGFR